MAFSRLKKKADTFGLEPGMNSGFDTQNQFQQDQQMQQPQVDPQVQTEVTQLLDRIEKSSNDLKDIYYSLFDNLNALYNSFPSIYQQLERSVKLPTNEDATNVVAFDNDLKQILEHFRDPVYLSSYLSNQSETL